MNRGLLPLALFLLVPLAAAGTPQLSVNTGNGQACPTGSGQYTLELYNPGPAADRYTVSVDAPWPDAATLSRTAVNVPADGTETVFLWVQAPKTASPGDHSFTVSASSSNNGDTVEESRELTVLSCRSVGLDPVQQRQQVCRGDDAVYRIDVENNGEVEETYRLSTEAGQLSTDRVTLQPGGEQRVRLTVS
ncbi:MAG: FixG Ig-like domain-containing protein, partial [Candidatus Nanohaloarchaea archaeon]|nr:FixG Ig-like domain-containing protein [Candidatus Nanohaloarchaea archaeon]